MAYHHGDLKAALLAAAATMIESDGVAGLTLRAVARAVDVTHAAPKHHFGDLAGLLSELAADGFRRLAAELTAAIDGAGHGARARAVAMGNAYLGFAERSPGMFALMFRSEKLDLERPALVAAMNDLREALRGIGGDRASTPLASASRATAIWSLVHGYAALMREDRLGPMLAGLPGKTTARGFFELVLEAALR